MARFSRPGLVSELRAVPLYTRHISLYSRHFNATKSLNNITPLYMSTSSNSNTESTAESNSKKSFKYHVSPKRIAIALAVAAVGLGLAKFYTTRGDTYSQFEGESVSPELKFLLQRTRHTLDAKSAKFKDPQDALTFTRQAIEKAASEEVDQWSNLMIGLRMQEAQILDQLALESFEANPQLRLQSVDRISSLDAIQAYKKLYSDLNQYYESMVTNTKQKDKKEQLSSSNPDRIAKRLALVGVKFAELLELADPLSAEPSVVFDNVLTKLLSREKTLVSTNESPEHLSQDQARRIIEYAAEYFLLSKRPELALPLFRKSLDLSSDCHRITVMNNIAACLQDQTVRLKNLSKETKDKLLVNAQQWAQLAVDDSEREASRFSLFTRHFYPESLYDCKAGCSTAQYNLGAISRELGDFNAARKHYRNALKLAKDIDFSQAIEKSAEGLASISNSDKNNPKA